MPVTCSSFTVRRADDAADVLGPRVAEWLEPYAAKELAQNLGVSVSTAEKWKAGHPPGLPHMAQMIEVWGQAFIEAVFGPLIQDPLTLEERAARIEQDMAALRRDIGEQLSEATHEAKGGGGDGALPLRPRGGCGGAVAGGGRPAHQPEPVVWSMTTMLSSAAIGLAVMHTRVHLPDVDGEGNAVPVPRSVKDAIRSVARERLTRAEAARLAGRLRDAGDVLQDTVRDLTAYCGRGGEDAPDGGVR